MKGRFSRQFACRKRPGLTLVEAGVALVVAATAALAVVELVGVSARQRRLGRQQQVALAEVANQAERIALRSWDECRPGELTTWQPSDLVTSELPSAKCTLEVVEHDTSSPARRIDLSIAWTSPSGQQPSPVRLTVWKHRPPLP